MKKRIFSFLLSIVMVLSMSIPVFAADPAVAKIGETTYTSLTAAISAAASGDTITLLDDITEDVTINKSLTIDGANKTYTGNINLTDKKTITIKNVNFDGKGNGTYAVENRGANNITIENCTAKNYPCGFVQLVKSTNKLTVKNVTASNMNYGVKTDYSNAVVLENVAFDVAVAGVYNTNFGSKTITIKDSNISSLATRKKSDTVKSTYVFEGENTVGEFDIVAAIDVFKLEEGATLTAPKVITATTDVKERKVVYKNGAYRVVPDPCSHPNMKKTVVEPTCYVDGYTLYECPVCYESFKHDVVDALNHPNMQETVVSPTCYEAGYTLYECPDCEESFKLNPVDALNHPNMEKTVVEPTCYEEGYTLYECPDCGDTFKHDVVAALNHPNMEKTEVGASCYEEGYTLYTCPDCGESFKHDVIDALNHPNMEKKVVEPTCYEEGYTLYTCPDCGESFKHEVVDPLNHPNMEKKVVEPTCYEEGYTLYSCPDCGESFKHEVVAPLNHPDIEKKVVEPTCTEEGYTLYSCPDCGESFKHEVVAATGHNYVNGVCTVCGDELHREPVINEEPETVYVESDEPDYASVTAKILWNGKETDSVKVKLLKNDKKYKTETLTAGKYKHNNWRHTWSELDPEKDWDIDVVVPAGYECEIDEIDEYYFEITLTQVKAAAPEVEEENPNTGAC